MDFSQRMGLMPEKLAQIDSMDDDLRVGLWNELTNWFWLEYESPYAYEQPVRGSNFSLFAKLLYSLHYKAPIDAIPENWNFFLAAVRKRHFSDEWHRIYSFLEFIVEHGPGERSHNGNRVVDFMDSCNILLESENSAYRFVDGKITAITSKEEIAEVEKAISETKYAGVTTHLKRALGLLNDRQSPDYRNSIKESISAVESLAKRLVGDDKATLGQALKILETKHNLHGSLKSAFLTLYGYTSDASGIRHALLDNATAPTKADARFMLICCSAFINFAIDSVED